MEFETFTGIVEIDEKWTGNFEGEIRGTVIVKMEADTSIFWIGYDGHSIATVSNQPQFSTKK